jgi:spermidine synthase
MAILWRKIRDGTLYEVRAAGNSRRLYTDGIFHSQYNPDRPLTGSVWDLLLLPAFFRPETMVKRVLVLGVGGGTVIQQLRHFVKPETIIGVELNPVHLLVARRYFGVQGRGVTLYEADAVSWLQAYDGPPFDMIIDDLFTGHDGEPVRAVTATTRWFRLLHAALAKEGVLVMNFADGDELRESAYCCSPLINHRFEAAFRMSAPLHENVIGVFLRKNSDSRALRRHLVATPGLNPNNKTSRLRYHIRRM